ncbi:unnamed protein product, partial [Mesorhabditis belari]|uniref:Uncharacterized protein n=1 Tax=Mesorhabditis belari TaxID=2138241 RepID=A0AAF3F506_9BILA
MQNIEESENHVENNRAAKGSYFFPDVKPPATPVSNVSSGLIAKESAAGITYDDKFAQLIGEEIDVGGQFYQLLVANQPIDHAVKDYVDALEAKLKVSKKPEDVIRLIDYFLIAGNIEEALRICKDFGVQHDIIGEDAHGILSSMEFREGFVQYLSRWAALALSPISRSIARSCIYHLVLEDAFQIQLKEHADLIDAKDALILASSILGNKHPVTNLLHKKLMAEIASTPTQASVQSTVGQIDLEATAASRTDLVDSYRAVVCLLAKPVDLRFNAVESLVLRQKYLEAIVAGKWKIVDGIGADIAKERCGSTDYLNDTLILLSTVGELVAAVLDVAESSDQKSPIRKLVERGASLKDVFKNGDLATTIFAKNHAEYNEEADQIAGSVDVILRALRSTSRKLQLSEEESKRLNMSLNLCSSLFKILIDLEDRVEAVKPSFPAVPPILDFFKKDLGQQFRNFEQNARMTDLLALFNEENGMPEKKNVANEVQNSIKQDVIPSVPAKKVEVLPAAPPVIEAPQSITKAVVSDVPSVKVGTVKKDTTEMVANVADGDKKVDEKKNEPSLVTEEILTSKHVTEAPRQKITAPPVDVNPFGPAPGYDFATATPIQTGFGETTINQVPVQNREPPAAIKKKPSPVPLELSAPPPLQPTNVVPAAIQTPATPLTQMAPPTPKILETNDFEDMDASFKGNFGSKQASYGNMNDGGDGRFGNRGGMGRGRGGYRGSIGGGFSGSRGFQ